MIAHDGTQPLTQGINDESQIMMANVRGDERAETLLGIQ